MNWDFCIKQSAEIESFSEEHRSGAGWTDMYLRGDNPHPIAELGISMEALAAALSTILPCFDRVAMGYSSYTETCQNIAAFGKDDAVVFFAEADNENVVSAIWLTLDTITLDHKVNALSALRAVERWLLILADWGWCAAIRLSGAEALNGYFDQRIDVFSRHSA